MSKIKKNISINHTLDEEQELEEKKKKRIVVAVILVLIAIVAFLFFKNKNDDLEVDDSTVTEQIAKADEIESFEVCPLRDEITVVDNECIIMNPSANKDKFYLQYTIYDKENNEIYQTKLIKAGNKFNIPVEKFLSEGKNEVEIEIRAYTMKKELVPNGYTSNVVIDLK